MTPQLDLFVLGQRARLLDDRLTHADLADVVEDARVTDRSQLLGTEAEDAADLFAVARDPPQMPLGVRILELHPARHREDHSFGVLEVIGEALDAELRTHA